MLPATLNAGYNCHKSREHLIEFTRYIVMFLAQQHFLNSQKCGHDFFAIKHSKDCVTMEIYPVQQHFSPSPH